MSRTPALRLLPGGGAAPARRLQPFLPRRVAAV